MQSSSDPRSVEGVPKGSAEEGPLHPEGFAWNGAAAGSGSAPGPPKPPSTHPSPGDFPLTPVAGNHISLFDFLIVGAALRGASAITPEGRPARGALTRAKPGLAYLACGAGVPVWPLAIYGHEWIFESWKELRRVPVTIRLGKGVVLNCAASEERDFQRRGDTIMKAIVELMPGQYHGVY